MADVSTINRRRKSCESYKRTSGKTGKGSQRKTTGRNGELVSKLGFDNITCDSKVPYYRLIIHQMDIFIGLAPKFPQMAAWKVRAFS